MRVEVLICDLCYTGKGEGKVATHRYHQDDDPVEGDPADICEGCVETVEAADFHPYPIENENAWMFKEDKSA